MSGREGGKKKPLKQPKKEKSEMTEVNCKHLIEVQFNNFTKGGR